MKKIKTLIFLILSSITVLYAGKIYAADCRLPYNGSWTVGSDCDWPDGFKIYGDIVVGPYTITMGANDDMGINLASNKITFTTGKINLATTARIDNHVVTRYYVSVSYSTLGTGDDCDPSGGNQCTDCPEGMNVFNTNSGIVPSAAGTTTFMGVVVKAMPSSGTFYCGI